MLENAEGFRWSTDITKKGVARPAADDLDDVVGHARLGQRGCSSNAEGMGIDVASAREGGPQDFDDDLSREEVAVGEQK